MEKNPKQLDQKIFQIHLTYKTLNKSQIQAQKRNLIKEIRRLCSEAQQIIEKQNISPQLNRKKKQIQDTLKNMTEIQKKLQSNKNNTLMIKNGTHQINSQLSEVELQDRLKQILSSQQGKQKLMKQSRSVARSIMFYEIQSKNMKISDSQIDKLAQRFYNLNQLMKQIELMVIQNGGDIDQIEQNIKQTYQRVKQAKSNLDQAAKLQKINRLLKIRLGLSGFLGVIGMRILGIPGLIFGFLGGMIATK